MVEGPRMALGFCMVKVGLGGSTVRITRVLRKDVKGGDYRNAMIPGALRGDLTSSLRQYVAEREAVNVIDAAGCVRRSTARLA